MGFCVLLLCALLCSACATSGTPDTAGPTPEPDSQTTSPSTSDPELGPQLFAAQCAACHGENGRGSSIGPDLRATGHTLESLIEIITHGDGTMPAFSSSLTEEEIEAVARYVLGWQ